MRNLLTLSNDALLGNDVAALDALRQLIDIVLLDEVDVKVVFLGQVRVCGLSEV